MYHCRLDGRGASLQLQNAVVEIAADYSHATRSSFCCTPGKLCSLRCEFKVLE